MKPHTRSAFVQILSSLALINSRALARKAELAAGLTCLCPHRRRVLSRIERGARVQLQIIGLRPCLQ
jgi:hypothetical protein